MGMELTGKTAGVIGAGNIGAIVCDRLKGLRMNVLVYDPFISNERADAMGVTKADSVAEMASQVDVLTIHVPLLESTRKLINADILASMKDGAILVNCARGGIVDEDALYDACKAGRIYAALDVYENEPVREHPLFSLENVICTPHIGASTAEAQENVAVQIAQQIADYLLLGAVTNAINVPSVSEEEYRVLLPYLQLGLRLGQLLGQIIPPGYSRVTVHFEGLVSALNCKPVVNAALQGLLSQSMEDINAVNASVIAHERGIDISEVLREHSDHFNTLVRIEVEGDKGCRSVAGTVFDAKRPRLVQIDDCEVEIAPVGRILFIENRDRPGVVAAVGRILADAQINIADFRLGRRLDEQTAITLVTVDSRPDESTISALAALENLITVRYVELDAL